MKLWVLLCVMSAFLMTFEMNMCSAATQMMHSEQTQKTQPATREIAEHPSGFGTGTLVVLNKAVASASLVDLATGKEIKRLETGVGPHEVAISPNGKFAVVGDYGQRTPGGTLTVLDLEKQHVLRTIDLKRYHRPHGILFFDDGQRVVVTCEHEQALLVVDIGASKVLQAIDTDARISHMVALSPDQKRAFVANIGSGSLTVIDLEIGRRIKTIDTGGGAEGVDVSADGTEVWVTNRAADTVTVIDAVTFENVATLECPSFPIRVKFTPDGSKALVSNARSGDVVVFDAATRTLLKRISMEATAVEEKDDRLFGDSFEGSPVPVGILVHPDGRFAYVANTNADVITVLDLESLSIVGRLKAGKEPDGLGWSPLQLQGLQGQ